MAAADDRKAWTSAVKRATAFTGVASGPGWVTADDGLYVLTAITNVYTKAEPDGSRKASWMAQVKPRDVDPVLWRALGRGEADEKARTQLRLRAIGAVSVHGVPIEVPTPRFTIETADAIAADTLDAHLAALAAFRATAPDVTAFAAAIDAAAPTARPGTYDLLAATTAIARGDAEAARRLIEAGRASGLHRFEIGPERRTEWDLLGVGLSG